MATSSAPRISEPSRQPPAAPIVGRPDSGAALGVGQSSLGFVRIPLNGGGAIEELSERKGLGWIAPREQSWPQRDEPVILGDGYPCSRREVPPSVLVGASPAEHSFCVLRDPYERMVEEFKRVASDRPKIFVTFDECFEALNAFVHESLKWMLPNAVRPPQPYALNCQYLPQAAYVYGWRTDGAWIDETKRWCKTSVSHEKMTAEVNAFFEANGYPHRLEQEPSARPKACPILNKRSLSPNSRGLIEKAFEVDFRLLGFAKMTYLEFIHIPRSGGSAVEEAGKRYYWWGSLNEKVQGLKQIGTGACQGQHTPPSHLPGPFTGVETFCIVRDVYNKMVSQFRLLVVDTNDGRITYSCTKKDLNKFIHDYLSGKYASGFPYGSDCHFLPQGAYVYSWDSKKERVDTSKKWCTHVVQYEKLHSQVNSLWRSQGYQVRLKKQSFGAGGRGCTLKASDFSKESQILLNKTYKEDLEMLERLRQQPQTWPTGEDLDPVVEEVKGMSAGGLLRQPKKTQEVAPPERALLFPAQEIRSGSLVADDLVTSEDFELSFDITPRSAVGAGGITTVMRVTSTDSHYGGQGDRMPAINFVSRSTRLIAYMGHHDNHNADCTANDPLPLGQVSEVVARLQGSTFALYANGKELCRIQGYNRKYKAMENVKVWIGDRFNDAPDATVSNVVYKAKLGKAPKEGGAGKELAFISIPLNGGRAIEELSEQGPAGWGHRHPHLAGRTVVFSQGYPCSQTNVPPSLVPWAYAKRQTFCVVRDPYERMVSEFQRSLVAETKSSPQDAKLCKDMLNAFVLSNLQRVLGDRANAARPFASDCRFLPQAAFVYAWHTKAEQVDHRQKRCSRVLRYENLPKEANDFLGASGFPGRLGPREAGPAACSTLGKDSLNKTSRLLIDAAFRDDFRLLGFPQMDGKPPGVRTLLTEGRRTDQEGGLLLSDLVTSEDFQLAFELKPLAPAGAVGALFSLGGGAGGTEKLLACELLSGTTRLQCHMAQPGVEGAGCSVPDPGLPLETFSRVEVKLMGQALAISVNGNLACTAEGFTEKVKGTSGVGFRLGGSKASEAAEAVVANVHYKVRQDDSEALALGAPRIPVVRTLLGSEKKCDRGKLVLSDLVSAEEFEVSFDIRGWARPGPEGMLQSIMLFTTTNNHYGHEGDRMPALFFIGGSTRIIAYMGHPNHHNAECSATDGGLKPGKKHRVTARLVGAAFRLFVDSKEVCFVDGYTAKYGSMANVKVFLGDRYSDPATAKVSNLVYKVAGMSEELDIWTPLLPEVEASRTLLKGPTKVKGSTVVAQGITTSSDFEVSFDITPTGVVDFMSSVMLLSATGKHYGHAGDRIPAFLFMAGTTKMMIYMGHPGDHNAACSVKQELPLDKVSHISAVLSGAEFNVFINNNIACTIQGFQSKYPSMRGVKLWLGDQFNAAARATVANVVYKSS